MAFGLIDSPWTEGNFDKFLFDDLIISKIIVSLFKMVFIRELYINRQFFIFENEKYQTNKRFKQCFQLRT